MFWLGEALSYYIPILEDMPRKNAGSVKKSERIYMAIAGYGRHDSMQHGAKHSAYTIFSCNIPMIVCFSLVQASFF